jgi:hypothetical protein
MVHDVTERRGLDEADVGHATRGIIKWPAVAVLKGGAWWALQL